VIFRDAKDELLGSASMLVYNIVNSATTPFIPSPAYKDQNAAMNERVRVKARSIQFKIERLRHEINKTHLIQRDDSYFKDLSRVHGLSSRNRKMFKHLF